MCDWLTDWLNWEHVLFWWKLIVTLTMTMLQHHCHCWQHQQQYQQLIYQHIQHFVPNNYSSASCLLLLNCGFCILLAWSDMAWLGLPSFHLSVRLFNNLSLHLLGGSLASLCVFSSTFLFKIWQLVHFLPGSIDFICSHACNTWLTA